MSQDEWTRKGIRRWNTKLLIGLPIVAAALFVCAGTVRWPMGWGFIVVMTLSVLVTTWMLLPTNPELLSERAGLQQGVKKWDLLLAPLMAHPPLISMIIGASALRFDWQPLLPGWLQWTGLAVSAVGMGFTTWAMYCNHYFSALVRIQSERGHSVQTSGPYRWIRHPGYFGAFFWIVGTGAMGATPWALMPAGVAVVALVIRTALEDRTLHAELPGYVEYAQRVRWRLVPGVW